VNDPTAVVCLSGAVGLLFLEGVSAYRGPSSFYWAGRLRALIGLTLGFSSSVLAGGGSAVCTWALPPWRLYVVYLRLAFRRFLDRRQRCGVGRADSLQSIVIGGGGGAALLRQQVERQQAGSPVLTLPLLLSTALRSDSESPH